MVERWSRDHMLTSDWSPGVTATRTVRGERMSGTVLPSLVNMVMVNMVMVNMGLVNMSMVNMVIVNVSMVNTGPMCGDIMKEDRALVIISGLQAGGRRPREEVVT